MKSFYGCKIHSHSRSYGRSLIVCAAVDSMAGRVECKEDIVRLELIYKKEWENAVQGFEKAVSGIKIGY